MLHHFNSADFTAEVLQSELPVMVDFYADWCGPCRMIAPIVEDLSNVYEGKVKIGKVNVDDCPDIARMYNVMSIPMLLFIKNGKVVDQVVGALPRPQLEAKVASLL